MADSDGSPRRDDRHHRRSRSRFPVSPEWAGETPAEREERRLAEAAVLVGPPAEQPRAASGDARPSTQEPGPAEMTAPAAQAASPAAPPREGATDARGAETAAPASHAGPRPRPPARRRHGAQPRRRNRAHHRGLPQPQRGAGRAREGLRQRPR